MQAPAFTYWHLEKAGGSTIIALLRQLKLQFKVVPEFGTVSAKDEGTFLVGSVREPCDYYSSVYMWGREAGSSGLPGFLRRSLQAHGQSHLYRGPLKPAFESWLRYVTAAQQPYPTCGLLSWRHYAALRPGAADEINNSSRCRLPTHLDVHIKPPVGQTAQAHARGIGCPCPLADCSIQAPPHLHAACQHDLNDYEHAELPKFACWVRTCHLVDDLLECLKRFVARGGNVLPQYGELLRNASSRHLNGPVSHRPPRKVTCAELHSNATEQLVMRVDGEYRRHFGFGRCCEPHPGGNAPV